MFWKILMNCPGCKTPISDKDLVCPNCKKVIRLLCPVCKNITKNTVCEKCGTVLLNKCYKCGKLNSTTFEKCPKCGLNINASIGLRESVIEEFAVLTVEVTNFDDIKNAFKSDKITQKFKDNLYSLIKKHAALKKLRVQFLDNTYIIRFCKDYSFLESCKSAVDFSIYISQTVSEINKKLFEAKGIELKVQMAVQKRDVYSKPSEYKSGLNINVVYSSSGKGHLYNNTEVVVDSYIYQQTKTFYPYQSLSAVYVKKQMIMFFELVLHKIIQPETETEKTIDANKVKLPKNVDFEPEEEIDEEKLINFDSLNCTFIKTRQEALADELSKVAAKGVSNPIISVRSSDRNGKLALVKNEQIEKIFEGFNVIRFTCSKNNKYTAYGLFKQMLLAYRGIDELNLLLEPQMIDAVSSDFHIQEIFRMQIKEQVHPEDLRYSYFESFTNFVASIPDKTIFVIDDFEYIVEGSLEIIKYLCENKKLGNVGFLLSCGSEFSLHRKIYKLMTAPNYFDVELKPSSNKKIVASNMTAIKNIKDTFFFEKVLENTKGSYFYFNTSLKYLTDNGILKFDNNKYEIAKDRMLVLPKDLDELVQKRILYLRSRENAFELFGSILLLGEKTKFSIIHNLGFKDDVKLLKFLEQKQFIKIIDDKEIFVPDYNLYDKNFIEICEPEQLQQIAQNVLEKIYLPEQIPNTNKAKLLEYAKLKKEAFAQWHALAMISSQSGDFCAYLNCTNKFLSLVDNVIDDETDRTVEQVKMEVYSELASLMYKYYPDKIRNFLEALLTSLEAKNDDAGIKEAANKLVQSCLISGNYNNALEYIGKIISRTPRSSFDPDEDNFNLNYFLVNLVTLEIYFNLGRLNECIELGDELFRYIDLSTITENVLPEGFSKKQFEEALCDAMFFICMSRIILLKKDRTDVLIDYEDRTNRRFTFFKLMYLFNEFLQGKNIIEPMKQVAQSGLKDKYSQILFPIIQGLIAWSYKDWNNLGNYVYNAKLVSAILNQHQLEYFCDLMIGFAYQNLGSIKKAKQIYYNILDLSEEKGIKNITYLSWALIAKAEFQEGNIDMCAGIINNSILNLEKDSDASEFFMMIFKALSSEVMVAVKSNVEKAMFCAEQAFETAAKTKLNIYLPQFADMLMFIYNTICAGNQPPPVVETFKQKADYINRVMSTLAQGQSK